jgi:nucleoside-diphosphate-sugar epimerase
MKVLVTGSAGHLGEALVRTLRGAKYEVAGLDVLESPFTTHIGSIARVDLEDVVSAHLLAAKRASSLGFRRYIISATIPFLPDDLEDLWNDTPSVVRKRVPGYETEYVRLGWRMFPRIDRVYVNQRARADLGWQPRYDFRYLVERLKSGDRLRSPLAQLVGSKGYHAESFLEGPYPVKSWPQNSGPSSLLSGRPLSKEILTTAFKFLGAFRS